MAFFRSFAPFPSGPKPNPCAGERDAVRSRRSVGSAPGKVGKAARQAPRFLEFQRVPKPLRPCGPRFRCNLCKAPKRLCKARLDISSRLSRGLEMPKPSLHPGSGDVAACRRFVKPLPCEEAAEPARRLGLGELGRNGAGETKKPRTVRDRPGLLNWWAWQGLNLRPLRCQHSALPLSYTPTRSPKRLSGTARAPM